MDSLRGRVVGVSTPRPSQTDPAPSTEGNLLDHATVGAQELVWEAEKAVEELRLRLFGPSPRAEVSERTDPERDKPVGILPSQIAALQGMMATLRHVNEVLHEIAQRLPA